MMFIVMYAFWICLNESAPDRTPQVTDRTTDTLWHEIGFIPSSEDDLIRLVQQHLGIKQGRVKTTKGYVTAYRDHPWVEEVLDRYPSLPRGYGAQSASEKFWVAVDVSGPGERARKYLRTIRPVKFANPVRRPPARHPGSLKPTAALPIVIEAKDGSAFTKS
jgi:hypothetical protein